MVASLIASALFAMPVLAQPANKSFANPLGETGETSIATVIALVARFVSGALAVAGIIAVISMIVGGIRIGFARGNNEQIEKGKKALLWATIGLIVSFLGYFVINFVIQAVVPAP